MKIRNGFVSNSSSASFIISFHIKPEDFYNDFLNCFKMSNEHNDLNEYIKRHKKNIKKWIKLCQKELEEDNFSFNFFRKIRQENLISHNKELEMLESFKEVDEREKVKKVLPIVFPDMKIEESEDIVNIKYYTSMHNCFSESLPKYLIELILFYQIEKKVKMEMRMEE